MQHDEKWKEIDVFDKKYNTFFRFFRLLTLVTVCAKGL